MDTWKIVVIIGLICSLGGYGYYQANPPAPPAGDQPDKDIEDGLIKQFNDLKGKRAPAWNIEAKYWVNTPKPITLDDLKGNVTLLEFWRIGCSHCIEAAPYMEKVYEKYKANGLKLVAFQSPGRVSEKDKESGVENPETNWDKVQSEITKLGIKYPVAFDEGSKLFRDKYFGTSYPSIILIDKDGKVLNTMMGSPLFKPIGKPSGEAKFLAALHKALGLKPWSGPTLLSGNPVPTAAELAADAAPAPAADPHAGHNHAPGQGHGAPAVEPGHEGHNHAPGQGHGAPVKAAPGHEGHGHGPEVVH